MAESRTPLTHAGKNQPQQSEIGLCPGLRGGDLSGPRNAPPDGTLFVSLQALASRLSEMCFGKEAQGHTVPALFAEGLRPTASRAGGTRLVPGNTLGT